MSRAKEELKGLSEEDGIKLLQIRYAKWKEKQGLSRHLDFEEYYVEDPDDIDLDRLQECDIKIAKGEFSDENIY